MDKLILNGNKIRVYNQGNSQSGSIQYTQSRLRITGNNSGSGLLISDGKLYLKSGTTTASIIYNSASSGVTLKDGILNFGSGLDTSSIIYSSGRLLANKLMQITCNSNNGNCEMFKLTSLDWGFSMGIYLGDEAPATGDFGSGTIGSLYVDSGSIPFGAGSVLWAKYGSSQYDWGRLIQEDSSANTIFRHGTISVPYNANMSSVTSSIGLDTKILRIQTLSNSPGNFLTIANGLVASRSAVDTLVDIQGVSIFNGVYLYSGNSNIIVSNYGDNFENGDIIHKITMSSVPSFVGVTASTGYTGSGYLRIGGNISGTQITASITGQAPFNVASNTLVANLNSDLLDGLHASSFLGVNSQSVDSDKLDGLHATDFSSSFLPLAGGTMTGNISLSAVPTNVNHAATLNYIQSRGTQLVTNNWGQLENNYNFPGWTYTTSDAYAGEGCFQCIGKIIGQGNTAQYVPLNPSMRYKISVWLKTSNVTASIQQLFGFVMYDRYGNQIYVSRYQHNIASETVLSEQLSNGDTHVHLTTASGWAPQTSGSHLRNIAVFNDPFYANQGLYYYTPLARQYTTRSAFGITLSAAWNGGTIPAGTPVANTTDGNGANYCLTAGSVPTGSWTYYSAMVAGINASDESLNTKFRPGTAYIKGCVYANYGDNSIQQTASIKMSGFSFEEATDVLTTGDTMTGRLVSTYTASSPFSITSTLLNTNLNADLLDGNHSTAFATSTHNHSTWYVTKSGDSLISGDIELAATYTFSAPHITSSIGVSSSGYVYSGTGFSSSIGYLKVGGISNLGTITSSVGLSTPTLLVTSVTTASNLSVGNSTKVNNYPVVGMKSGALVVYDGTNITASTHTGDDFYGSWMSHAQCLARISLRI